MSKLIVRLSFSATYTLYQLGMSLVYFWFGFLALYHALRRQREQQTYTLEKLGFFKQSVVTQEYLAWVHGCSAGEINSAEEVIRLIATGLQQKSRTPARSTSASTRKKTRKEKLASRPNILLTYQSRSGAQRAELLKQTVAPFCTIEHLYMPLDLYASIRKLVRQLKPHARFILIEDDLWPCLLHTLARHQHPRILTNYELKGKSKVFYTCFPMAFRLTHRVSTILTLSETTQKIVEKLLGTSRLHSHNNQTPLPNSPSSSSYRNTLTVANMGNLKYSKRLVHPKPFNLKTALTPYPAAFQTLIKNQLRPLRATHTRIITLASSHVGEEQLIAKALTPLLKAQQTPATSQQRRSKIKTTPKSQNPKDTTRHNPTVCLIIAPRHSERGQTLAQELSKQYTVLHLNETLFATPNTKSWNQTLEKSRPVEIIVISKLGLLKILYSLSDWVIIGDTFVHGNGGHNFLEATALGVPVICGKHLRAFADSTPQFEQAGVLTRCHSHDNAALHQTFLTTLLHSPQRYKQLKQKTLSLTQSLSYDQKLLQKTLN